MLNVIHGKELLEEFVHKSKDYGWTPKYNKIYAEVLGCGEGGYNMLSIKGYHRDFSLKMQKRHCFCLNQSPPQGQGFFFNTHVGQMIQHLKTGNNTVDILKVHKKNCVV